MPQFIAAALLPLITASPIFFLGPAAVSAVATGLGYLTFAGLAYGAQALLAPKQPDVPKPEDGKFALRQNVPAPAYVLGRAKRAGDYLFLEETDGRAFHIIAMAAHEIEDYVQHYLHDEAVTLEGGASGDVITPEHFDERANILIRRGVSHGTAYQSVIDNFPGIWTADHRGDGMATICMKIDTVDQEDQQEIFPSGMPSHSAVMDGALLYDPRDGVTRFSRNLALMRLWHLTHPVGAKLKRADLYMPDWIAAANCCDEAVTNKAGGTESRYHGGFWFRGTDDPRQVGLIIDEAADLVVYERADGLVGVHAGKWVEPDITLDDKSIISLSIDANRRLSSTVLAVRGRYTDPALTYNTADAAIIGDPYISEDETERTRTIDNQAIQSHNHCQRIQNLAFLRANSPRIHLTALFEAAREVRFRRFIKVHYPPKLNNAYLEITGRPRLSLRNLTYEIEGILVTPEIYTFDETTQEGNAPPPIIGVVKNPIPVPLGFDVVIDREPIANGATAAYGVATWSPPTSGSFSTEIEWEPTAGGVPVQRVVAKATETSKRTTGHLADGGQYKFRARHISAGVPSAWTGYVTRNVVSNVAPPTSLTSCTVAAGQHLGFIQLNAVSKVDPNLSQIAVYLAPAGVTLDKLVHQKKVFPAVQASSFSFVYGDAAIINMLANPGFATDTLWGKGTGWTISGGVGIKAAGAGSNLAQTIGLPAATYRAGFTIASISGGTFRTRLTGGTAVDGPLYSATGSFFDTLIGNGTNTSFSVSAASATSAGSVDDAALFAQTAACAPQGVWDVYPFPVNASGVEGPGATPILGVIIV